MLSSCRLSGNAHILLVSKEGGVAEMGIDVIVVGAGAAGITCARRLLECGHKVLVLEARDRAGGRVYSVDSLRPAVEYGAEFIHGAQDSITSHLESFVDVCDTHMHLAGRKPNVLPGFWESLRELSIRLNSKRGHDRSIREFLEAQGKRVDALTRAQFVSYVEGFYAADLDLLGEKGVALAEQEETPALSGKDLFRPLPNFSHFIKTMLGKEIFNDENLQLSTSVSKIELSGRGCTVSAQTQGGETQFQAKYVVLTVPLSLLKSNQPVITPYPPELAAAISGLHMGFVERITFEFSSRFWEGVIPQPIGFMHAGRDSYFPTWWTQMPLRTNRLTAWQGGPKALEMQDWSEAQKVESALETLARLTALDENFIHDEVRTWYMHNWSSDPYSMGAYSYAGLEGEELATRLSRPFSERLFVAGEATVSGASRGTVHGAIESGARVAKQILAGREKAAPFPSPAYESTQADLADL